jgi:hypothetical protein
MTDFQQFVGPFQLHEQMGHTPITNRYRATDKRNDQAVTLYILTPDAAQQPSLVEQFLNIGSQAMRLQHPGLVPVVDVGDAQGFIYIATQWVEGQSLADRLRWANSVVNVEAAAYILNALAAALDYAHQQGFIHGHITLDQIYITNNNEVLLDGLEQAFQAGKTVLTTTPAEGIVANPVVFISPYMAPEQAKAGEPIDQRADIYSLGAVLYAMLLGQPPFTDETSTQLLRAVVEEPPLSAETINPALPPAMIYVLKLVLAKEPSVRYASASEFANAFLQSTQWRAALPVNERAAAYQRRGLATMLLLPLLAILCFALLTGAGLGWFGERFAFLPAIQGGDLAARLRGLLGSDQVAAQLTAEPVMLTPVVMVTMTTPTATPASAIVTATPTTAAVAMAMSVTETATTTAITTVAVTAGAPTATTPVTTALPPPVNSATVTTTTTLTTGATPANRKTALAAATGITATPSVTTSTLVIDPLGLLAGPVAAGTVIINGAAEPGAAVQVEVNGRSIGSTETKVSGTWSMIVDLSQPGAYDISATVVDGNGLVVAAVQQPVTVVAAEASPTLDLSAIGIITDTSPTTPTATVTPTPIAPTATNTAAPTATATAQPTATNTNTVQPTATNTPLPTATNTATPAPTATVTHTPQPTATATHTSQPTATLVLQPTDTPTPKTTATNTSQPTATATASPQPTATNTPLPTATATNTPLPTATVTNTSQPTATATNTPRPTATATNTPQPTATATNTPRPTATATNTPRPTATATNTPRPTATTTNTPRPTATATNTPRPTATTTNTPRPTATATNTPRPTATATATATNTPVPTATNTPLPTATNTPVPPTNTPRPTNTPAPTATNTPVPTPTAVTGSIVPVSPGDGNSGQGQQTFTWTANFAPSEGYAFELVFWKADQDPLRQSFGMAAPTTNLNVTLDLPRLDEQLGPTFDTGEYRWGVILVRTTPTYERVQYLGGGYRFTYYRGGGDSGSGGQESGE